VSQWIAANWQIAAIAGFLVLLLVAVEARVWYWTWKASR